MRKFKILSWPKEISPFPDFSKPYPLLKEFDKQDWNHTVYCLNVDGRKMYFYPNEVKEVTNE